MRERLSDFIGQIAKSPRLKQILNQVNSLIYTPPSHIQLKKKQSSTTFGHGGLGLEQPSHPSTQPLIYKVNWTAPKYNFLL